MLPMSTRTGLLSCLPVITCWALAGANLAPAYAIPPGEGNLHYIAAPSTLWLADLPLGVDVCTVTDIEIADFDGDMRNDIAVAWYATDNEDTKNNARVLTLFFNTGTAFERAADIDLYRPNPNAEALSIFRNGTADIGIGDFDGDGDTDLAVSGFFGDELWFVENLGARQFTTHLCFPFGFNSPAIFLTPPEMLSADFDGDGRDELVYLADPLQYYDSRVVHFWTTGDSVANMHRVDWEGIAGGVATQWTRGLAVGDFDADGCPDLCYSGSINPPFEDDPVLTLWYDLNPQSRRFAVANVFPEVLMSDVVCIESAQSGGPFVLLADLDGETVQWWAREQGQGPLEYSYDGGAGGFAGLAPGRGMSTVAADVDGDGRLDLVTKQKVGSLADANQIEIALWQTSGQGWERVAPTPIDTEGWYDYASNQILRPRSLAVGDLHGNALPEIVAGFAMSDPSDAEGSLSIALWQNSCLGDVDLDGATTTADMNVLVRAIDSCRGDPLYNPHADLDKNGCVTGWDVELLLADMGCVHWHCHEYTLGDMDCDCRVTLDDITPFLVACRGEGHYYAEYPYCNWLNGDLNGDWTVDFNDIDGFVELLGLDF